MANPATITGVREINVMASAGIRPVRLITEVDPVMVAGMITGELAVRITGVGVNRVTTVVLLQARGGVSAQHR